MHRHGKTVKKIFVILNGDENPDTGNELHRLNATLVMQDDGTTVVEFSQIAMVGKPSVEDKGLYATYPGATLTAKAFDSALPGLGKWLVTLVSWFFAISTMISWSYYGEQGIVFMFSQRSVPVYRYILCLLVVVATMGFIETPQDLDNFSALGNGLMLWVNIPITLFLGYKAMAAYKEYIGRLKSGEMQRNPDAPSFFREVLTGKDVE